MTIFGGGLVYNNEVGIRVLMVAISYSPLRLYSDKQFLNDLIKYLPESTIPAIWTLSEIVPGHRVMSVSGRDVPVTSCCRIGHKPTCHWDETLSPHPRHNAARQQVEISASLAYESVRTLRQTAMEFRPDVMHFFDNPGPVIPFIQSAVPNCIYTISKPSARIGVSRMVMFYRALLKNTYNRFDKVVAYTDACKAILSASGVDADKLVTIHWGGDGHVGELSASVAAAIRGRYNCDVNERLVVVLPRGTHNHILSFIRFVVRLSWALPRCVFVFAIRPTRYQNEYAQLATSRVHVESGPIDFPDLLATADVALALHPQERNTSLPPLVWLEAIYRGTPLIVPANPGVGELLNSGKNGYAYNQLEDISSCIDALDNENAQRKLYKRSPQVVPESFTAAASAAAYASLWHALVEQRRANETVVC